MAEAKVGSSKKAPQRVRKLNGLVVKPVWFNGKAGGLGAYMAGYCEDPNRKDATFADLMVLDERGVPLPFMQIGGLDWA